MCRGISFCWPGRPGYSVAVAAGPRYLRHTRHARTVVHCEQHHSRHCRLEQPGDAPVGRVGGMRRQDDELGLAFFDDLAMISSEPDARIDELNALYRDERVRVPRTVFNAESRNCRSCRICSQAGPCLASSRSPATVNYLVCLSLRDLWSSPLGLQLAQPTRISARIRRLIDSSGS